MCSFRLFCLIPLPALLVLGLTTPGLAADHGGPAQAAGGLEIASDPESGKVIVSWTGHGVLKQGRDLTGHFRAVGRSGGGRHAYLTDPTEDQALFLFEAADAPVQTANVVGYVNLALPRGLSLIANPLYFTNNTLPYWMPRAPDGAQVYRYTAAGGYEVSTFDANAGAWSNPNLLVPVGDGFYFNNPSTQTFSYTFVGEVHVGFLTNQLPAGVSTKGSLVPQAGSINTLHGIPGEPGDELRIYTNDQQGGGAYSTSVFDGTTLRWNPDLNLGVAQGFWIQKANTQDWIRFFYIN